MTSIKQQLKSLDSLKYKLSKNNIRVTKNDREDMNNIISLVNDLLTERVDGKHKMLEVAIIYTMRQVFNLKKDLVEEIDSDFIVKFVARHMDSVLTSTKEWQLGLFYREICGALLDKGSTLRELPTHEYIKTNLEPLIYDIINYNRAFHDNRIDENRIWKR
jgi:hypothetical protein